MRCPGAIFFVVLAWEPYRCELLRTPSGFKFGKRSPRLSGTPAECSQAKLGAPAMPVVQLVKIYFSAESVPVNP
jgi:hypothetical protein